MLLSGCILGKKKPSPTVPDYAIIKIVPKAQPEEQRIPRAPECQMDNNEQLFKCVLAWRQQWCQLASHGSHVMYRMTGDKYAYIIPDWCLTMLETPLTVPLN